jgi:cyclophilin family peptidyl-prolyl cis-trans isomerase
VPLATVVGRFRLALPEPPAAVPLLTAASLDAQLSGARLLAAPGVSRPEDALLESLPPFALIPLVRSLATRADTPSTTWSTLLRFTAPRARQAPRLWGNAWRALRDALPSDRADLSTELSATVPLVQNPRGLTGLTLAWWNCDNAAAVDTRGGQPALTLGCAPAGYEWVARVAQARVLGEGSAPPARRAAALTALRAAAQGHPQVLAAVATAATALPVAASGRLVRTLAAERDPAVMAALLEGLADHPEQARALPIEARQGLVQAPFEQPEGPTLEARLQALRLLRTLGGGEALSAQARASTVRALRQAGAADAGLEPPPSEPIAPPPPPARLRITTSAGGFELALQPRFAPAAAAQVLAAATQHRYDGLTFHRVVPGFVAQGGDPRGDGYGGTDVPTPTELSLQPFARGAVGIPLAGLDTGGIQLFIVTADAPHLDGRYPWLGTVRQGMEVVEALLPGDRIERVEVLPAE